MATGENGQHARYTVVTSESVKATLKEFRLQAVAAGKGERFLQALRAIGERLQQDPVEFGEPLYELPALGLVVYQAVLLPVVVIYGVHEMKSLVFIRHFKVLL